MSQRYRVLPEGFYDRDAETVARDLLGALLVSDCGGVHCVGRIVETEAYPGPHDPASHAAAAIGRTARNEPMFGPPGCAYIHLNYGVHWCLNVVVGPRGFPAAVLLRALEPLEGIGAMRGRRGSRPDRELTSGPAKLTRALGIGPELQRHSLWRKPLFIATGIELPSDAVGNSARIGISKGADRPWRYFDRRSRFVSRAAPGKAARRRGK